MDTNGMEGTLTASQSMDSVHMVSEDEGYESSLLKVTTKNGKTSSPVGFVTFTSRHLAEQAKQDLQGVKFDPELPQAIRLEFAKSNTKVSKPKQQSPPAAALPTFLHPFTGPELVGPLMHNGGAELWHPLAAYAAELASPAAAYPAHPLLQSLQTHIPGGHISHLQLAQLAAAGHHPALMTQLPAVFAAAHAPQQQVMPTASAAMAAAAAASIAYNNPCSTLFVANLGPNVNEQELKEIFASFPGFCRLRMHNKNGSPVAFVEYTDVRQAIQAMSSLQGFTLLSSDRGGIRIEFAKHKMGESTKKDENFNNQSSPISVQSC